MRYDNPQLSDKLAAEYVLGTLQGRARTRFEQLLKYKMDLRRAVSAWEARLMPLAESAPAIAPPARVWRTIEARIAGRGKQRSFWSSVGIWQSFAAISSACAFVLAALLAFNPEPAPSATVAVLADSKAKPAMVVSWTSQALASQRQLKVQMLAPLELPAGKSFELWMLPAGKASPVSLGIITAQQTQTVTISETARKMLPEVSGLAVSVEPAGGSQTGLPTGPVIASGSSVKV